MRKLKTEGEKPEDMRSCMIFKPSTVEGSNRQKLTEPEEQKGSVLITEWK